MVGWIFFTKQNQDKQEKGECLVMGGLGAH
jgi:hypothetical protein